MVQQSSNQVISEEHKKQLVHIFFALIIAVGFNNFLLQFLFPEFINKPSDIFSPKLFNMFFFFVTLFWFLCHWVFYHELIHRYPYYRWRKFFVDILLFALMFIILSTSYQIYDGKGDFKITNFYLFMVLVISWYILAIFWHISDRQLRTLTWHLRAHYWRLGTYLSLLLVYLFLSEWFSSLVYNFLSSEWSLSYEAYREYVNYVIMASVMIAIILYSIKRLTMFISKKQRLSLQCCLFYNNDGLIQCLNYKPQSIASQLIIKTGENLQRDKRELWNDILNYCSRDLVEYLILYCLLSFMDISKDAKQKKNNICTSPIMDEFKDINIFSEIIDSKLKEKNIKIDTLLGIMRRLEKKNIFRASLPDLQLGSTTGNTLLTIYGHESNIKPDIYPQIDFEKIDSRMIVLTGRHFTIEIKYRKGESFPSSLDFMPNNISLEIIKKILANNFSANSTNTKRKKTKIITYTIEFDATVNTLSRMYSFLRPHNPVKDKIQWLNDLQGHFKQFFSITD